MIKSVGAVVSGYYAATTAHPLAARRLCGRLSLFRWAEFAHLFQPPVNSLVLQ